MRPSTRYRAPTTWANTPPTRDCQLWSIQHNEHCYYGDQKKARSIVAVADTVDFSADTSLSRRWTQQPDAAAAVVVAAAAADIC